MIIQDIRFSNKTDARLRKLAKAAHVAGVTPPMKNRSDSPMITWYFWLLNEAIRRGLRDLENDHKAGQLF